RGSGIYVTASAPHLTHLTFVGNTGGDGSGVRLAGNSTAWLTNTIMTQQAAGVWAEAGSAATLNATLWWANTQNTAGSVSSTNNYSGDPVFVNPAQQNYHIALGSAAINQGVATPVLLDIDGLLRDNFPDLGADEYRTCWVRLNDSPTDYAVVQDAIAAGAHATDVIKIAGYCTDLTAQPRRDLTAAGIVSQVAYLTRTLTLQGGYTSTNFTVAYPVTQPTTLAAMDGGRVLYVSGDIAPVVRGLTLTGGNAAGQGGDAAGDAGGGVYVITGTLTLSQTALVSNTGARGGGLYVASGAAHLYNAIVAQNSATEGGGAYGLNATLLGVHTTWAENTGASGLHLTGASTAALTNTILVSHTVGIHAASGSAATLLATLWHNNTQDTGGAGAINTAQDHTGAPAFVAPAAFDYHIHFASAAIDRGVMALPVDIDQEPRPAGDASDLGADEYPAALRLTKHATSAVARAGDMLTYTLRVTNTGLLPYRASISDILPDQVSPGGVQTWSVYLYPQDVWSRTLPVRIAADYAGWLTNTARATATVGLSATAIVPTFVSIEADLSLGKTGSYVAVPPGAPVTYTLTYFNAGPGVVSGVVITDLLPAAIVNPTVTSTPLVTPVVGTRYAWEVGDISPYMGGEIIIAGFLDTGLAGGLVISNTASVVGLTVDVNPANNHAEAALTVLNVAPGAQADAATTQENTPVTVDVLDNDEDLNGDALTVTGLEGVTQGVVTWSGALVTYTPTASFNGTTVFTYVVTDGALSSRAPVVITVNPTNDPPVAVDDTATTPEDTAVNIAVLSNDSDVDSPSAQWSVTVVGAAASGAAVRQSATMVRYTPNENFNGTDAFTYTMSDGDGGTATAWVTVTVTPVNDPPVAGADFVSTPENTPRLIAVLTNDTDVDGDALILAAVGVPTSGNAAIQGNQVLYTPATGYDGIATFTYTVSDGSASDGGLVTVDVGVPNQAPTAMDDEVTTPEDTPVDIPVLDNDTDLDGDPLFIAALGGTGRAVIVNTFIRYTPANNFYGAESFTYTVSDGLLTDTTWVTVTVTPVNDVPVARADGYSTDTDTVLSVPAPGVLANDTDVEGTALSAFLVSNVTHGALTLRSDGSFIYTPTTGFTGQAVCTYRAYDGEDYSNVATVIIGVDNHPPTASDDAATTDEDVVVDIPVLENDSDPDGNPLSIAAVGSTRAAIVGDDVRYTPAENFHGVESFTYTVSDGVLTDMAWVVVTVLPVNDAPVAVDDAISTPTGMAREIAVLANDLDPDGDPLTLTVVGTPTSGSATIQNNRVLYTPGSGVAVFTYTVSDGALSDTGRVTVTVGVENHAPVAVDDTAATVADTPVDIPVLDNDTDPEGDLLFIAAVGGEHTVIVGNDVRYTPAAGFTGAESFTYTVSDGLLTDTAWVTVTVTAGNRAPVAVDDVIGTPTGVAREIAVLANDLDPDGDPLTLTVVGTPTSGSATIQNNRVLYTPGSGVAVFTYTVSDGALSDTGRVTVTVGVENHAPVAVDDTAATVADTPVDIPVLDNDTDPEGDLLFIAAVGGEHTVIVGNDVRYTPAAGFTGAESFTYTVSDGLLTDTAWVTVAVGLENHAPVAVNDNYATPADTVLLRIAPGVLANDTDADGDALTAYLVGIPLQGQVVLQPDGGFTYTPTLGFTGYDTFTYRVFDALAYSNVAAVRINVGLGNQPPTAADATVNTDEDTPVSSIVSADDPDGDSLNYTVSTTTLYGTVVLTQSTGAWRYTPTNRTATYQDHFQVTVSDGELTAMALITIVVTADNDAPYFTSVQITSATATVAYAYAITAADPDQNDTVGISATVRPAWLTLTGTGATATLQGTPAVADVGSHSVTLEVRDAGGLTALQSFTVTVSEPPQQRIFLPLVLRNAP
ncbi:MAG TPA: Ig-like domain-containing protein, partial [Anaerolineae bacterium]|nr:Ig-like domain-containing protein [Anaerolineae bacterium]